jgi:hypothetical protein
MPNLMLNVKEVIDWRNRGFPGGKGEKAAHYVPILLARITELENALVPFAHLVQVNANIAPDKLVSCYMKDCIHALEKVDISRAAPVIPIQGPPRDNFFDNPAE